MSVIFDPSKMLKRIAPDRKVKKLLKKGDVSLKRTALSFVDDVEFLNKKRVTEVALKTAKSYRERIANDTAEKSDLVSDPKQLIQRVQNEIVLQIGAVIQKNYGGQRYVWLPSSANVPDPEHQLNYGKEFVVGEQEDPGQRYGCQCGMEIITDDKQLNLGE